MSPLKSLHLYSRTPSDLQTSTNFGGVLSIVTMSIMGALLYANLRELLIPTLERSVMIDATYDQPYALDFNLTLVHLPCAYATVNLADAMGQSIHNLTGLRKMRLDATSWEPPYHKLPATSQPSALLAHATVGSDDDAFIRRRAMLQYRPRESDPTPGRQPPIEQSVAADAPPSLCG